MANNRDQVQCNLRDVLELRQERDQLRAELAAAKEHLGIAINNAAGWRKRTAERRQKMKELAAHVERLVGALDTARVEALWIAQNTAPNGTDSGDLSTNRAARSMVAGIKAVLAATPAQSLEAVTAPLMAHVERLVGALKPFADRIKAYPPWMWTAMVEREKQGIVTGGFRVGGEAVTHMPAMLLVQAEEAIATTPAQSLAAHDAALLREVAKLMDPDGGCHETLMAEADRIERDAAPAKEGA